MIKILMCLVVLAFMYFLMILDNETELVKKEENKHNQNNSNGNN